MSDPSRFAFNLFVWPSKRWSATFLVDRSSASVRRPRIDREALAADQPFLDAAAHCRFEQFSQKVAVAEAAVAVLGEGRMIRNITLQTDPAEPTLGEVQMHLFAQPNRTRPTPDLGLRSRTLR